MLPVLAITRSSGNPFGWLDGAAAIVTTAAVALETIADEQKGRHPGDGFLAAGVWAWVRHPNYLGEIAFWWGLYLFGLAAGWSNWWTVIGPAAMTLLFVFVSVPLMDRRMERRPGYVEYRRRVPALLPRMRGRG
jgi:steroid 5-alpha reductase family enzyme